jgi:hypothetical protein
MLLPFIQLSVLILPLLSILFISFSGSYDDSNF